MDMSDSSTDSSSTSTMMMVPYLHFTGGDALYFSSLAPTSSGAIAGASIVLVVIALIDRLLFAIRGAMEDNWRRSLLEANANRLAKRSQDSGSASDVKSGEGRAEPVSTKGNGDRRTRTMPPFIPSIDLTRGALYALQAFLTYALMLAVMTFQAAYIISIIVGLGIGEVLFGRYGSTLAHLH
ncbi:copper transporter [Stereum hirsutum FP-91666 SS1]|uniref:copper transporter n=1 Tax=Stereum hirsutum (strain FP-91666) TaxID=721885 RepID=UPI000440D879|nr:copper transporter [Stereum hirsutum FP-91666 SS1]EIM92750.1 copper transporter [Stereum hirsutum FP-91666 SS1]